jgi:hypothetical protein
VDSSSTLPELLVDANRSDIEMAEGTAVKLDQAGHMSDMRRTEERGHLWSKESMKRVSIVIRVLELRVN